jgi:octaprenyl-diphosphate synthase
VGHDLRERKVTLPLVGALRTASPTTEAEITEYFTVLEPKDEAIAKIVTLVRDLGGVDYALKRAHEYAERAEEALEGLDEGPALAALRDSINYVVDRNR